MVLYKFDVCFYAFSIIEMRQEKNWKSSQRTLRACERVSVWASARKCVINVPSIQFLYTCSNIYNVIANNVCDNLSISVSLLSVFRSFVFLFHFVIWRSNFPFTLALKHQSNFDRVNSVVYSSLKASWNYGWVGGWAIPSGSLIFAIKYDSVWLTVAITEAASAHSHPSSLANVTHLKCEIK